MADAPKILGTDSLRQAYPKLNTAIDNANLAISKADDSITKSNSAITTANSAVSTANSVQNQLNQIVIEGDSSVEAAQARGADDDGTSFTTLNQRLDYEKKKRQYKTKQTDLYAKFYKKLRDVQNVVLCAQGDSMTYSSDFYSSDKRAADTTPAADGTAHTATRASKTYPEALGEFLNSVYGSGKVTVINRGFSGDGTQLGYQHWSPSPSGADITILCYGINDAGNTNIPYMGDVETYLKWYRKIIEKVLDQGSAIILMTPPKQRIASSGDTDTRTDVDSFGNAVHALGAEYNIPVVDGNVLLAGYPSTIYSDYTHLNGEGYTIFGARIASWFIGEGVHKPYKVTDGTTQLSRPILDNFKLVNGAVIAQSVGYPTPAETDTTGGTGAVLSNSQKVIYSIYCENDGLIAIPSMYSAASDTIAKLSVDFGVKQADWSNDYRRGLTTANHTDTPASVVQISRSQFPGVNGTVYNSAFVYRDDTPVLYIAGRGWHTITVEAVTSGTNTLALHGIDYYNFENYKRKVNKVKTLALANSAVAFDTARTPKLIVKPNGSRKLTGTVKTAPHDNVLEFANLDTEDRPNKNITAIVALSSGSSGGYAVVSVYASGKVIINFSSTGVDYCCLDGFPSWLPNE